MKLNTSETTLVVLPSGVALLECGSDVWLRCASEAVAVAYRDNPVDVDGSHVTQCESYLGVDPYGSKFGGADDE